MFPFEFKFKYSQNKSAKELRFSDYKARVFTGVQYLTMILVVSSSFFTGVARPDYNSWNISQHCGDPKFNQPLTLVDKTWAIVTIVVVTLIIVCLMSTRMLFYGWENKDVLNITNYFFGFLSLWVACYALKNLIGYPIPSFFTNDELYAFYCCKHCHPVQTKKLTELDHYSRGSFPSFLICAISYSTAFLFVVCTYLDEERRFAAKLLALLLPGGVSFTYSWYLWQSHENHLQDVVGGAVFGTFLGAYIARDIFKSDNTCNRFHDDFVTVLMAREIIAQAERANRDGTNTSNEYVINLYPHEYEAIEPQNNNNNNNAAIAFNDDPPPYSSLNLAQ